MADDNDFPNDQSMAAGAIPVWFAGIDDGKGGFIQPGAGDLLIGTKAGSFALNPLDAGPGVSIENGEDGTIKISIGGSGGVIQPDQGGTGVANGAKSTITVGGPVEVAGAFGLKVNLSAATDITFPTKGTLAPNDVFTKAVNGLVPGPAAQPGNTFLRDNGAWAVTPVIYHNTDSGDALNVPNSAPPSTVAIAVSVSIPASSVARVFIVSGYVSYGGVTGASPNYGGVSIVLDPGVGASFQGTSNMVNTINDNAASAGATGVIAGVPVTIPGDNAIHVIALGIDEKGAGTGFTTTTGQCNITAIQVP